MLKQSKFFISILLLVCFTVSSISGYAPQMLTESSALRPLASIEDPADLQRRLGLPTFKPIRISESPDESHYWNLYHRLYALNRHMLSLASGVNQEQIDKILEEINKIAAELPGEVSRHRSLNQLRKENERLTEEIKQRYKELERAYLESLKMVGKPKKMAEYERLNQELDRLNKQQTNALIRRSLVQLASAKKFLGKGPKWRHSRKRQAALIGPAMSLVISAAENMQRVTVEIYWKRARQYILAYGRKFIKEIEAEGLLGEPVKTISLADWDVHLLDRGPVTVRTIHWEEVLTSFGRKVKAPIWKDVKYDDIAAACRAQVHIMESQHHEILKILSSMSQLRYIINFISPYQDKELPLKLKEQAIAELELYYQWLERGFVRPKQLGATELEKAISSLKEGKIKKTIQFITHARNRLSERVGAIESIKGKIRKRFASLNDERKRLVAKDEDVRETFRRSMEALGIKKGVKDKAVSGLDSEKVQKAQALLISLQSKYFKRVNSSNETPRAKAKKTIETTIGLLDEIKEDLRGRDGIFNEIGGIDSGIADLNQQIGDVNERVSDAQKLNQAIEDTVEAINDVRRELNSLIPGVTQMLRQEIINNISALLTAAKRINPGHCRDQLRRVSERLNGLRQDERIDGETKEDIGAIIKSIRKIIPAAISNYETIQRLSPPNRVFGPTGVADAKYFLLEEYPKRAAKQIAALNELPKLNQKMNDKLSLVFDDISTKSAEALSLVPKPYLRKDAVSIKLIDQAA